MNDVPKFHGHYEFLRLLLPTFHMINNVELELHRFFWFDFSVSRERVILSAVS